MVTSESVELASVRRGPGGTLPVSLTVPSAGRDASGHRHLSSGTTVTAGVVTPGDAALAAAAGRWPGGLRGGPAGPVSAVSYLPCSSCLIRPIEILPGFLRSALYVDRPGPICQNLKATSGRGPRPPSSRSRRRLGVGPGRLRVPRAVPGPPFSRNRAVPNPRRGSRPNCPRVAGNR
jgi:hypothetical protein